MVADARIRNPSEEFAGGIVYGTSNTDRQPALGWEKGAERKEEGTKGGVDK